MPKTYCEWDYQITTSQTKWDSTISIDTADNTNVDNRTNKWSTLYRIKEKHNSESIMASNARETKMEGKRTESLRQPLFNTDDAKRRERPKRKTQNENHRQTHSRNARARKRPTSDVTRTTRDRNNNTTYMRHSEQTSSRCTHHYSSSTATQDYASYMRSS